MGGTLYLPPPNNVVGGTGMTVRYSSPNVDRGEGGREGGGRGYLCRGGKRRGGEMNTKLQLKTYCADAGIGLCVLVSAADA